MSALAVFQHEQFGDVQVIAFDGAIYFNPDMVAKALGYKHADSMLRVFEAIPKEDMSLYVRHFTFQELSSLHLKVGATQTRVKWNSQGKRFLTEPGLFFLLNRSEKPLAYPFQKWVNTQVLPQIRQTGAYPFTAAKDAAEIAEIKQQLLAISKQQQAIQMQQKEEIYSQILSIKREMQLQVLSITQKVAQEMKNQLSEIKKEMLSTKAFPDEAMLQSKFIKHLFSMLGKLHEGQHLTQEQLKKIFEVIENYLEKPPQPAAKKKTGYTTQEKADLKLAALILQDDFKRSPLEIAAKFNEDGVETLSGKGEWTAAKVKHLLRS